MNTKNPIIITEDTLFFKKGQLLENFKKVDDGVEDNDGNFLAEGKYIVLTEHLSSDDEKKIKDMIRRQIKLLLWNMFTKNSIIIGNL